jgi:hypothetical protein
MAVPLSERDKAYYEGWAAYPEAAHRNGWVFTEAHVMDAFEALEKASRELVAGGVAGPVEAALASLDELRRLNRGFRD